MTHGIGATSTSFLLSHRVHRKIPGHLTPGSEPSPRVKAAVRVCSWDSRLEKGLSTKARPGEADQLKATMNVTEMDNATVTTAPAVTEGVTKALTTLSRDANTTVAHVITTAIPASTDGTIVAIIAVILLTIAVLCFLLYRYLCHNKGDYRTTGELAPGEDFEEELHSKPATEKKEYFI